MEMEDGLRKSFAIWNEMGILHISYRTMAMGISKMMINLCGGLL